MKKDLATQRIYNHEEKGDYVVMFERVTGRIIIVDSVDEKVEVLNTKDEKELDNIVVATHDRLIADNYTMTLDKAIDSDDTFQVQVLFDSILEQIAPKQGNQDNDDVSKYKGKDIRELGKLFYELGNNYLVPELSKHIKIALSKFKEIQEEDDDLCEMIIVADLEEKIFVFAGGDGSDLTGKDDSLVFHIAESENFNECMSLLKYISIGNHPEGYLSIDSEVYHWITDAMPEIDSDLSITIYGNYDYGETKVDPFWE